ncbi:MAG TPA: gluconolaconase [Polyangia bacterium]|jgi:sugar lactone lactonase YvrE|nr:gluconolaconase [Polyangia bacterium]
MKSTIRIVSLWAAAAAISPAVQAAPPPTPAPTGIEFKAPAQYPEGIAFNPKTNEFFVSSMRLGVVGAVKADGTFREFAKDPLLVSVVGMHADPARDRLLVCVSDPGVSVKTSPRTQKKIARLVAFDLATGKRKHVVELDKLAEGQHFCNDLTIDDQGNVYVTDSFTPVIYRVDSKYKASVFLKSDTFKGEGFNLNGIVHHAGDYLLVAKYNDGTIWKVDEKDPKKIEQVAIPEKLPNADGLILTGDGELVVAQNGDVNRVVRLKSTDGFKTAKVDKVIATSKDFPTTLVVGAGGKLYVMMSRLGELFADPAKAKSETFTLMELKL